MVPFNSYKPLQKVRIIAKNTTMKTGRGNGWGPSKPVRIFEAFQYAIVDGIEQLDDRGEVMFDLTEEKLRRKCRRHGLTVVN